MRRLVDEHRDALTWPHLDREVWTDEQFDVLATHPDDQVRAWLARSLHSSPDQRVRLVEDSSTLVLLALAEGPDTFLLSAWTWSPPPALPAWAYRRIGERDSRLLLLAGGPGPSAAPAEPAWDPQLAAELAVSENALTRSRIAADPRLPADLVTVLAQDPEHLVRLAVSMRPELTEQQRAAIDHHVGPEDRIQPAGWAVDTTDPEEQRRCAESAHLGLRRSVACNPHLGADLIAVLAGDPDFAVRLLLCERHPDVPPETVLGVYLESGTMTNFRLPGHPAFPRAGLARLAGSPDPRARALAVRDPGASPELVDRLSRDDDRIVRARAAADPRLPVDRLGELLDDRYTAASAAANPRLPIPVMHRILDGRPPA